MMKRASIVLVAAALVSVIAAASGCSSSTPVGSAGADGGGSMPPATPPATPPDPCSLLTDDQAATLFGSPVSHMTGDSRDASNGSGVKVTENLCEYDEVTSSQLGYDLWVAVYAGADRAYFDDAHGHFPDIPALGDAAFGDSIHVFVIRKGVVLQIYGSLPGSGGGLQQAAKLAIGSL